MNWQTVTIGDLGKVVTGKTPPSAKPDQFGGEYPFITPSDIRPGDKHVVTERFLSEKGIEAHKRITLPGKSVCVVCIASVGKVCITDRASVSNQQINSVIVDSYQHDADFVFYLASQLRDTLLAYASGSAVPIVKKSTFSKIKLRVPDRSTQRKIAAVLTAYDDLIEVNKRRIALLEKMAEELYREWFVRMRFPGYANAKFSKGSPDGWDQVKLDSLIPASGIETGKRPKGGAQEFGVPSVGAENVVKIGAYDFFKEKYVSEGFYASMKQGKVQDKDILFYKDGAEIGRVTLFQDGFPHEKCCVNEHVFLIRTDNLQYQYFLYFYLNQPQIREYVKLINKNAAQPGINQAELRSIPVPRPPPSLVDDFNDLVSPLVSELFVLAKSAIALQRARDLLLPRLLSGKLSVEGLDIQFPPSMMGVAPESEAIHA